jgi:hypothetical protein
MDSENNVELKLAAIEVLEVKINHYSKELERVKDHYQFFFQNSNTTNDFKHSPTLARININIAGLGLLLGELKSENIDEENLYELLGQAITLEEAIKEDFSELHIENDHRKYETSIKAGGVRRHKQKKSRTHKRSHKRSHKRTHKRLTTSKSYIMIGK